MPALPKDALGLYFSIPFCRSKCTYCNFASGVFPASEHGRYVDRLIEDLSSAGGWAQSLGVELPCEVDTIYLGGGTPSLLEPELFARLFAVIRAEFALTEDVEITVECAPGQIEDPTLEAMLAAGVDRVSLGVQSFVDREAAVSGRLHNRAMVLDDISRLRAAGIDNINVDLIAGLAGQTPASWDESVSVLIDCGVSHASIYMLEVDEDSRLGREVLAHGSRYYAGLVPTDAAITEMYTSVAERLAQAGLDQYEISNFSRPGFESRHNLRYWLRRPYLGIGLDASSALTATGFSPVLPPCDHVRAPVLRSTTTSDLKDYLTGASSLEMNWVSPAQQHEEAWFLGLRLNSGVDVQSIEREFGRATVAPALEAAARLAENGLVERRANIVALTARGRLLSNEVFQEFLELDIVAAPVPAS